MPRATGSVVHAGGLPGGCLINLGAKSSSLSDLASGLNLCSQTALDGPGGEAVTSSGISFQNSAFSNPLKSTLSSFSFLRQDDHI